MLLIHGFGDTPQTLRYLAEKLHSAGYRVSVPLLPGHGTTPEDFFRSTADEWISTARERLHRLSASCESVSLVGLSMGAAIAVILGAEVAEIPAIVLLSPYLTIQPHIRFAAVTHRLWDPIVGPVSAHHPESIRDSDEREQNVGYGVVTGRALGELRRVVNRARDALGRVTAPTLLIQSVNDPRISPKTGSDTLNKLRGVRKKQILWVEGAGHIITVDFGKERVLRETKDWIDRYSSRSP